MQQNLFILKAISIHRHQHGYVCTERKKQAMHRGNVCARTSSAYRVENVD